MKTNDILAALDDSEPVDESRDSSTNPNDIPKTVKGTDHFSPYFYRVRIEDSYRKSWFGLGPLRVKYRYVAEKSISVGKYGEWRDDVHGGWTSLENAKTQGWEFLKRASAVKPKLFSYFYLATRESV